MIDTVTESLYTIIAITGVFGVLLIILKDFWKTYKEHSILDNIGFLFICLAFIEIEIMLILEIVMYYMKYNH